MDFFGLLQLNSIQIGQNKYFTFLAHNEELTLLEGVIRWNIDDLSADRDQKEEKIYKFDLYWSHKSDRNDPSPKHVWEFVSQLETFKNSDSKRIVASLSRKELGGAKWKVGLGLYELRKCHFHTFLFFFSFVSPAPLNLLSSYDHH